MLSKASQLAPENSLVLLHDSQTLMRAGQMKSAQAMLAKFKSARATERGARPRRARPRVSALGSPEPVRSVANLEKLVAANPGIFI